MSHVSAVVIYLAPWYLACGSWIAAMYHVFDSNSYNVSCLCFFNGCVCFIVCDLFLCFHVTYTRYVVILWQSTITSTVHVLILHQI